MMGGENDFVRNYISLLLHSNIIIQLDMPRVFWCIREKTSVEEEEEEEKKKKQKHQMMESDDDLSRR